MDRFKIYTDGACDNIQYPNYGSWAYLILEDDKIIEQQSGSDIHTTNNRMEMLAIILSLMELPYGSEVEIFTDSQYCIGAFSNKYRAKANTDLIKQFRDIERDRNLSITFTWVRGHSGDEYNEIVDKLANDAYEKASGKKITDFGRIKTDKEYRNQVFKNSKENERNKMIAEVIMSVINDERPKTIDYVQSIVEEINYIFRTIK